MSGLWYGLLFVAFTGFGVWAVRRFDPWLDVQWTDVVFVGVFALLLTLAVWGIRHDLRYWRACDRLGGHSVGTGHYTTVTTTQLVGQVPVSTSTTTEDQTCSVAVSDAEFAK